MLYHGLRDGLQLHVQFHQFLSVLEHLDKLKSVVEPSVDGNMNLLNDLVLLLDDLLDYSVILEVALEREIELVQLEAHDIQRLELVVDLDEA